MLLFGYVLLMLVASLGAMNPKMLFGSEIPEITSRDSVENSDDPVKELEKTVNSMKNTMAAMGRQMILQQLYIEEKIRSDADSGVKQIRHNRKGTKNYYTNTHSGQGSVLAIHDHSNNIRTVGMGEFVAVLNGVEFRTRHNDYRLYMPHRTSKEYHAVENIPFPDVPPQVTEKPTVNEQVEEMREWFKAFANQNHTVRDYRKYFKPILCYLEGAWTSATKGNIDEGFESDRHFIDAESWFDLQEKIRFTSYSGRKDNLENYSFLPTTIMNMTEDGYPQFAQWNYRILCNPIDHDIPLNRLRVVDEIGLRMAGGRTYDEHTRTRSARFQLNPFDRDEFRDSTSRPWDFLDELMSQIPGVDNYQGNLTDEAFDLTAYSVNPAKNEKLRAGRYHRVFKVARKGAMGLSTRNRGYADNNLFMAMNTQDKVAGMQIETCSGRGKNKKCKYTQQKWTYAIPLEIIYLTPLSKWNPYDLEYKGDSKSDLGKTVEAGGRNGGKTEAKAYDGTHSRKYYVTPVEFFSGKEVGSDAADTTQNSVGVLDQKGRVRITSASGTRIFFPPIPGIPRKLRQRYPIMPVHGEGSAVWKELEALKDLVNSMAGTPSVPSGKTYVFKTGSAKKTPPGPHEHLIMIPSKEWETIKGGELKTYTSTQAAGHTHDLKVNWNNGKKVFQIFWCSSGTNEGPNRCADAHPRNLIPVND